jgi:uncharacterized protein YecE (DUF72 family)
VVGAGSPWGKRSGCLILVVGTTRYGVVIFPDEVACTIYRQSSTLTNRVLPANSVPAEFQFSVKLPKTITHESKLSCTSGALSTFFQQINLLKDKLGPVLIQLPPSLNFDFARSKTFLLLLRDIYLGPVALEPRHRSWFEDRGDQLLQDFHVARVAADPPGVPTAGMPGGHTSLAYFRLHGSPRTYYSAYSSDFLNRLAAQLRNLSRTTEVWCVFDNTASGYAIENARQLISKIAAAR